MDLRKKKNQKQQYITRRLKEAGLYKKELSLQAGLLAHVLTMMDHLMETEDPELISTETSREGNDRKAVSPYMQVFEKLHNLALRDLRALGMNTDSKPVKPAKDDFANILQGLGEDD